MIRDIPLGKLALASAQRKTRKSALLESEDFEALRGMFDFGLHLLPVVEEFIKSFAPDIVVCNHGTYVEHGGLIFNVAIRDRIPTCNWQAIGPASCTIKR